MPQPIERVETNIIDGFTEHDDRPIAWERVVAARARMKQQPLPFAAV